jgi:hypothetical protein
MVNYMERFPSAGFGLAAIPSGTEPYPVCIGPSKIYEEHFFGYGHLSRAPGSSIIKLESFNKIGGFSGARMIGDLELWCKLGRYFDMVKFPFDLYWNRLHDEQESRSAYAKQYPVLIEKALNEALNHPDCPLNVTSLQAVKKVIRKQKVKGGVLQILSNMNKLTKARR